MVKAVKTNFVPDAGSLVGSICPERYQSRYAASGIGNLLAKSIIVGGLMHGSETLPMGTALNVSSKSSILARSGHTLPEVMLTRSVFGERC